MGMSTATDRAARAATLLGHEVTPRTWTAYGYKQAGYEVRNRDLHLIATVRDDDGRTVVCTFNGTRAQLLQSEATFTGLVPAEVVAAYLTAVL